MSRRFARFTLLAVAAAAGTLTGCSAERSQLVGVQMNPAPELWTLRERPDDAFNQASLTTSTNVRSLNSDVGRFLLLDRPSRLTPEPVR